MSKKNKNKKEETIGSKSVQINSATIKDDYCHYAYEITAGVGLGDTHAVKGKGIIKDDMRDTFRVFNAHMAVIDDVFKHSG